VTTCRRREGVRRWSTRLGADINLFSTHKRLLFKEGVAVLSGNTV
jgi:hypothetical protein